MNLLGSRWLGVSYQTHPEDRPFLARLETQRDEALEVGAVVLSDRESERFFGLPLARRGMQPVWLTIKNHGQDGYRLRLASLDANYFPALEAAYLNHFAIIKRLLGFGFLLWLLFPMWILLPIKVLAAWRANRKIDEFFQEHSIGWGLIRPGEEVSGFVYTTRDEGTKQVPVRLMGETGVKDFHFAIAIPGLKVDHSEKRFDALLARKHVECSEGNLRRHIAALPAAVVNRKGDRQGDPMNLVVIGEFETVLNGFGARWDETEVIGLSSCIRTARSFLLGSTYRYSPVSSLYFDGRPQDFALQRARQTINQRLHLRLWLTDLRFGNRPVWAGQISRDIGVRFTLKTWNLTTHKIDPDVDDARDFLIDDLWECGRVSLLGYVPGVGEAARASPRRNLTGDPFFTDGLRALVEFSPTRTKPRFVNWA